jgi:hypothetical protein
MDNSKIEELLEQADNRYSIAEQYDEWRKIDKKQATQKLEKLAKSYGKDELFEEYFIDRVKQLNYLTDKQLLQEAESFSSICKSEMADGKSLCYSKHYAEITLWREFVDEYCRLYAEVYDYADKHGVKDDPIFFASDCAESYVNERITDVLHLKETFKADWQQEYLSQLQDRMMREQETEVDPSTFGTLSTRRKTHEEEIWDMMYPEGMDDGFSLPED